MKRLLCLILSTALLAALTVPPAAEETADARLARVTQAVKNILALDTSAYETFRGSCSEELVPIWNLSWESERQSLSIEALEDGSIISLYRWESDIRPADYRWAFPTFPETGGENDQAIAEEFLRRVLRPGETVDLEEATKGSLSNSYWSSWRGTIRLNGVPSSLNLYFSVENGQVENFSRDIPEASMVGGVPSPSASVEKDKASVNLKNTLELRLEYVFETPGVPKAVLRYVPQRTHEFLVDAKTNEFLDVTELREKVSKGVVNTAGGITEAASAMDTAEQEKGFTSAERDGIQELEGALSKEELDKALRAVDAYGLQGYALASTAFERLGEDLVCNLRYGRISDGERLYRTFYLDAKTGEVKAIYSSAPWDREPALTRDEALEKAEAFLKEFCPDRSLALEDGGVSVSARSGPSYEFHFIRQENGIPFPGNEYHIGIDSADGSVYYLSITWDEGVTFQAPSGIVSRDAAEAAWAETYDTVLAYRSVPQKLTAADPIQARLMEQGADYYYALRLTYGLEREEVYTGVDAKTGKPILADRGNARGALAYTDLSGSAARADIEKLAQYGVGYRSDSFRPSKTLTQWELVALLYSLQGNALDPGTAGEGEREDAYFYAYRNGVLRQAERNDSAVLTRADLVRMLLDAAGYGPAARLGGEIFTCAYTDKAAIPSGSLGYAAVAQALGMAAETYAGSRSATRGEAASMLCRVLERKT